MLFYSAAPPPGGYALNLANAGAPLRPPDYDTSPDEYRGVLQAAYRRDPRPFVALARDGRQKRLTLYSTRRPDLVAVLYDAIVGVARRRGWAIDGGHIAPMPMDTSEQDVRR